MGDNSRMTCGAEVSGGGVEYSCGMEVLGGGGGGGVGCGILGWYGSLNRIGCMLTAVDDA